MSQRQPMGIHHLTVVPENAEREGETAVETDRDGTSVPRDPSSSD